MSIEYSVTITTTDEQITSLLNKLKELGAKVTKKRTLKAAERFDEFWSVYPKKADKKKCKQKWASRKLDKIADIIINDVKKRRIYDVQWIDGYIPNPQTYINGDKWEDEIQTRRPSETHKRLQFSKSQAAGDAIFGGSGAACLMGMGETGGQIRQSLDEPVNRQPYSIDYQGRMDGQVVEIQERTRD